MTLWRFTRSGGSSDSGGGVKDRMWMRESLGPVKKSRQTAVTDLTLSLSSQFEVEENTPSFIPPAFFTVCNEKKKCSDFFSD